MKLDEIGFYTLTDERAKTATAETPLSRCELVLSSRCNFKCPYCRRVGGPDLPFDQAVETINLWGRDNLKAIRFSGGEPTLYKRLPELVALAADWKIKHIAISTNGSAPKELYDALLAAGVNDFSISLDACCAAEGDVMAGGIAGAFDVVVGNIKYLSDKCYVTVGVVLTDENALRINEIIGFAHGLGVADIRVIPAAQCGWTLPTLSITDDVLSTHPILKYRVDNLYSLAPVRGLREGDSPRCGLVLDDMAVNQGEHYPCIIYMRESGKPIGEVGENMREERATWWATHKTHLDPICSKNCLDVCVAYNNKHAQNCA